MKKIFHNIFKHIFSYFFRVIWFVFLVISFIYEDKNNVSSGESFILILLCIVFLEIDYKNYKLKLLQEENSKLRKNLLGLKIELLEIQNEIKIRKSEANHPSVKTIWTTMLLWHRKILEKLNSLKL